MLYFINFISEKLCDKMIITLEQIRKPQIRKLSYVFLLPLKKMPMSVTSHLKKLATTPGHSKIYHPLRFKMVRAKSF
jgi:hypothetical protein